MSRDDGFRVADVDTGLLDDPKVRALVRACRDEGLTARCVVGYLAVLTASWSRGDRIALEDAAPLWLENLDDLAARLASVGLLDELGRIPERAWSSWFEPAATRLETTRERWRRANAKRYRAATARSPRVDIGDPVLTVLSSPSSPSSPTSHNGSASTVETDVV